MGGGLAGEAPSWNPHAKKEGEEIKMRKRKNTMEMTGKENHKIKDKEEKEGKVDEEEIRRREVEKKGG